MDIETKPTPILRASQDGFRWDAVEHAPYKEDGAAPFKSISRQTLFKEPALGCEVRYFEMDAGGYSTLERHEHTHAVIIFRGSGQCLLGDSVHDVKINDLITIPAWAWHQFRAAAGEKLGFLCMVNHDRDRPQLPTEAERAELEANPAIAQFLAGS
jgi:quercetin dioxygenase-like cupin family protein